MCRRVAEERGQARFRCRSAGWRRWRAARGLRGERRRARRSRSPGGGGGGVDSPEGGEAVPGNVAEAEEEGPGLAKARQRGHGLVEYGLIVPLLALLALAGLLLFGTAIDSLVGHVLGSV